MEKREEAKEISLVHYETGSFEIQKNQEIQNVIIKQMYEINDSNIEIKEDIKNIGENDKLWATFSDTPNSNVCETIADYNTRTELIDEIVNKVIENNINGVCIDLSNVTDTNLIKRFMVELTPKLREIGVSTSLVINEGINQEDYKNIVDYIVK